VQYAGEVLADLDLANMDNQLLLCEKVDFPEDYLVRRFLMPFVKCKEQFAGSDPIHPDPCIHDLDCAAGVKCDVARHSCLVPIDQRVSSFLKCFLKDADLRLLGQLIENINVDERVDWLAEPQRWQQHYQTIDCIDPFRTDWALLFRTHYDFAPTIPNPFCGAYSRFDSASTVPFGCDNLMNPSSFPTWNEVASTRANCEAYSTCNWNNSVSNQAVCEAAHKSTGGYFCAVCDSGPDCVEIPALSEEECVGQVACVFQNGTIAMVDSEAVCTESYSCEAGGEFNEYDCEDAGKCDGTDKAFNGMIGVCVLPYSAWRRSDCNLQTQRPTKLGCADVSVPTYGECSNLRGYWLKSAGNPTFCATYGSVCLRRIEPWLAFSFQNDYQFTHQNELDCLQSSNASWVESFPWTYYSWRPGMVRKPQWIQNSWAARWRWGATFDFIGFKEDLTEAAKFVVQSDQRSYAQCKYKKLTDAMTAVACACDETNSQGQPCFNASRVGSAKRVNEVLVSARDRKEAIEVTVTGDDAIALPLLFGDDNDASSVALSFLAAACAFLGLF
jgi:hypothetical protein